MAATIKIKNSSTAGAAPTSSDLVQGELAVNVTDKRLFTENSGGTVVELGTNPSSITLPDGSASAPTLLHSGDTNTGLFFPAADTIALTTGGSERLRLDSSGNLGLNVTPSAWGSPYKVLSVNGIFNSIAGNSTYGIDFVSNAYYSSGWKYTNSSVNALKFDANDTAAGQFTWQGAGTGTADGAISWTTRMVLDASGNLGLAASSITPRDSGATTFELYGPSSGRAAIKFTNSTSGTGATDGMFLGYDSSLNFNILNNEAGAIQFGTANTERARIDSSGNLLVGMTSAVTSGSGVWIYNNSGTVGRLNLTKTASGTVNGIANYYSGTYVGGVDYSNTATSFPTSSDIRLKKDIVDAGSASAKIDQIRIVSHGWKHDDEVVEFGVIAQELNLVAPQAVTAGDEGEEIEKTWGVDYSKLVPMLIKAHQEQQAIIESLTARITALEAA